MKTAASFALLLGVCWLVASTNSSCAQTNNVLQTATTDPVAPSGLSKGASDVVKLLRAGKPDNVLLFYVRYSELDYRLSADDVIYLKKVGISTNLIKTMMETDAERQKTLAVKFDEDRSTTAIAAPNSASAIPTSIATTQATVQPSAEPEFVPSVIYPDYSGYPNYYETFDNSGSCHGRVSLEIGIGIGIGSREGFYHGSGFTHGGRFGGRR